MPWIHFRFYKFERGRVFWTILKNSNWSHTVNKEAKRRLFGNNFFLTKIKPGIPQIDARLSKWSVRGKQNKTRTSKVGAISKAQKEQNIFFGKKLVIFEKKFFFQKSRKVPKTVKGGTLWDLLTYIQLQNMKKTRRGPFWDIKNFFSKKKSHSAEKIQRGDPLGTSGFVGFLEKVKKWKGDPLD